MSYNEPDDAVVIAVNDLVRIMTRAYIRGYIEAQIQKLKE